VRNVGADGYTDVDLRDAINSGQVIGPHMQVSGPLIGITGGHCDDDLLPFRFHAAGDGVADASLRCSTWSGKTSVWSGSHQDLRHRRRFVQRRRSQARNTPSKRCRPSSPMPIAWAAGWPRTPMGTGNFWATEAGVDSIEHGSYIDDAGIAAMKKHGTYLVPTLYLEDWMVQNGNLRPSRIKKWYHQRSAKQTSSTPSTPA